MYRVTIDREACDGVFACLTRDDRFVEDGDGLATFDEGVVEKSTDEVVAEFDDDRREDAAAAAEACPFDAIAVEEVDG